MRSVVLEDATLAQLARIPTNLEKFTFLRSVATRAAASCCAANKPDFNAVKAAVASLPDAKMAEFKRILGASQLRILYRVGGQTMDVTF
jgi:hypothetical protein